jgi:hypothetical protein
MRQPWKTVSEPMSVLSGITRAPRARNRSRPRRCSQRARTSMVERILRISESQVKKKIGEIEAQ